MVKRVFTPPRNIDAGDEVVFLEHAASRTKREIGHWNSTDVVSASHEHGGVHCAQRRHHIGRGRGVGDVATEGCRVPNLGNREGGRRFPQSGGVFLQAIPPREIGGGGAGADLNRFGGEAHPIHAGAANIDESRRRGAATVDVQHQVGAPRDDARAGASFRDHPRRFGLRAGSHNGLHGGGALHRHSPAPARLPASARRMFAKKHPKVQGAAPLFRQQTRFLTRETGFFRRHPALGAAHRDMYEGGRVSPEVFRKQP